MKEQRCRCRSFWKMETNELHKTGWCSHYSFGCVGFCLETDRASFLFLTKSDCFYSQRVSLIFVLNNSIFIGNFLAEEDTLYYS